MASKTDNPNIKIPARLLRDLETVAAAKKLGISGAARSLKTERCTIHRRLKNWGYPDVSLDGVRQAIQDRIQEVKEAEFHKYSDTLQKTIAARLARVEQRYQELLPDSFALPKTFSQFLLVACRRQMEAYGIDKRVLRGVYGSKSKDKNALLDKFMEAL